MLKKICVGLALALTMSSLSAESLTTSQVEANLKKVNSGRFAESSINVMREVPFGDMKGLYQVKIDGQELITTASGEYAIIGQAYDLTKMVNISQEYTNKMMSSVAAEEIPKLDEEEFIVFNPEKDAGLLGTLYVFTDPTCGYCQKLHAEISEYMDAGVQVKYIPYPRSALVDGQQAFEDLKQVMCADDRLEALTKIKNGTDNNKYVQESYDPKCVNYVKVGKDLGQKIGLSGTPFLYLSTGETVPGYNQAQSVIARFKNHSLN